LGIYGASPNRGIMTKETRKAGKNSKAMWKIEDKCKKCKEELYITRLSGRLFCRNCWEYR